MATRRNVAAIVLWIVCASTMANQSAAYPAFSEHRAGDGVPELANGRLNQQPIVEALALGGRSIRIDGKLDEEAWRFAQPAGGFTQAEPNRGSDPTVPTVFKVAYDSDAIYFAVACFESDMSLVSSALSRRDRIDNSDQVSIYVDPYLDHTTGYNFRVNPDGVQMDQYVFDDGNMDRDWDAVWEAETSVDENGWYAELRIPFSSVRYRPSEEMTWGLQVYRWMHGRGEDTGWVNWERNDPGFVSHFGRLTGLRNVPAPRQLEIVPYFAGRLTEPSIDEQRDGLPDELDHFENFGADLKYGVTADLTLNATIQPDFGQVEADPATLNLSPFETFFQEKRPFFIEGARSFEHPSFALVYTRRIGTGDENARIRYAGKLTGKTVGDLNVATLFAATDLTGDGQAHNFLKTGREQSYFAITRFGKEFDSGARSFNLMQTGVWRNNSARHENDGSRRGRNGFTSGADAQSYFLGREYQLQGSFVYSMVDPTRAVYSLDNEVGATPGSTVPGIDHSPRHGTGGNLQFRKLGGNYRGGIFSSFEHDKLDLNDMGILGAPDDVNGSLWLQRRFDGDGDDDSYLKQGNVNFNFWRSWFYGAREFEAVGMNGRSGSYGRRKPQSAGANINGWMENRHRWSMFYGLWHDFEGRDRYATRGGPIMRRPAESGFWLGGNSDWRKSLRFNTQINVAVEHDENSLLSDFDPDQGYAFTINSGASWTQNSRLSHDLSMGFRRAREDDQWLDNFENPGGGIGGTSYVFARLDNRVFDITLRSNVLFNRRQSLELYVQPFLAVGNYYSPKELSDPDSYDFVPYPETAEDQWDSEGNLLFAARNHDFEIASVNLNAVYRWEYRPGSTLFLVWTHARGNYQNRAAYLGNQGGLGVDPFGYANDLSPGSLFSNEPENTILMKFSYWFSI